MKKIFYNLIASGRAESSGLSQVSLLHIYLKNFVPDFKKLMVFPVRRYMSPERSRTNIYFTRLHFWEAMAPRE